VHALSHGAATGKGDEPSPTIMALREAIGVAPEIALRPPATMSAARMAVRNLFTRLTSKIELGNETGGLVTVAEEAKP